MHDSGWQEGADPKQWPTTEIYPDSPWNYALILNRNVPGVSNEHYSAARSDASGPAGRALRRGLTKALGGIEVVRKAWPEDNFPFTLESVPLEFRTVGRRIPSWTIDRTGLCGVLPDESAGISDEVEGLTLVPMGAARLRISAFPTVSE